MISCKGVKVREERISLQRRDVNKFTSIKFQLNINWASLSISNLEGKTTNKI